MASKVTSRNRSRYWIFGILGGLIFIGSALTFAFLIKATSAIKALDVQRYSSQQAAVQEKGERMFVWWHKNPCRGFSSLSIYHDGKAVYLLNLDLKDVNHSNDRYHDHIIIFDSSHKKLYDFDTLKVRFRVPPPKFPNARFAFFNVPVSLYNTTSTASESDLSCH